MAFYPRIFYDSGLYIKPSNEKELLKSNMLKLAYQYLKIYKAESIVKKPAIQYELFLVNGKAN